MLSSYVSIVVDEMFGSKAAQQAALGPIWVIRSPENQRTLEALRKSTKFPPEHLTVFNGGERTPEETVLSMLGTVDLHHPGWLTLEVVGTPPSETLRDALDEFGSGVIRRTPCGFVFSREAVTP